MLNLLERLQVDARVALADYYAEKFPMIYRDVLSDLRYISRRRYL